MISHSLVKFFDLVKEWIVPASLLALAWQIFELRRATTAQTFDTIIRHLQREDLRSSRKRVFGLRNKPFDEWNHDDIFAAEQFCHTYDTVGIMIRHRLLPKRMFLDNWGDSIDKGYDIVMPLIEKYRRERSTPEKYDDFVWLAEQAAKYLPKIRRGL